MAEFLYGVDTGCLKKFGKLRTDAVDAEQVGVVGPFQDKFGRDACGFGKFLAAFGCNATFEKLVDGVNAGFGKLLCVGFTNTFDVKINYTLSSK